MRRLALIGAVAGLLAYALVNTDVRKLAGAVRGVDPVGRRLWLLSGFLGIAAQTCLIAATHDTRFVGDVARRVVEMGSGWIVRDEPVAAEVVA